MEMKYDRNSIVDDIVETVRAYHAAWRLSLFPESVFEDEPTSRSSPNVDAVTSPTDKVVLKLYVEDEQPMPPRPAA